MVRIGRVPAGGAIVGWSFRETGSWHAPAWSDGQHSGGAGARLLAGHRHQTGHAVGAPGTADGSARGHEAGFPEGQTGREHPCHHSHWFPGGPACSAEGRCSPVRPDSACESVCQRSARRRTASGPRAGPRAGLSAVAGAAPQAVPPAVPGADPRADPAAHPRADPAWRGTAPRTRWSRPGVRRPVPATFLVQRSVPDLAGSQPEPVRVDMGGRPGKALWRSGLRYRPHSPFASSCATLFATMRAPSSLQADSGRLPDQPDRGA
jgi:hypothetical protein